jgi:hypothetical protein
MYLDLGARRDQTEFHLNFTGADNWALLRPPHCNCSIAAGRCLRRGKDPASLGARSGGQL